MNFKEWLNEEVDVVDALTEKAEKGLSIKTKYGKFVFDSRDGKKFVFKVESEEDDAYKAVVTVKKNEEALDVAVALYSGDELIAKRKAVHDEDEKDHSYSKLDSTKKAVKDIKDTIEAIITSEKDAEDLNEDVGAFGGIVAGLAPLVAMSVPALYKMAVENRWFGFGDEKVRPSVGKDDMLNYLKSLSKDKVLKLLKDEKEMDAFVEKVIAVIKKESPRLILNPKTKGEIYNKIEMNLRRIAQVKEGGHEKKDLAPIRDAAKEVLGRSVGSKHGGLYLGKTY